METERIRFLLTAIPDLRERHKPGDGPPTEDQGAGAAEAEGNDRGNVIIETLAGQIISGDPPEVWETAQRLWAQGHTPEIVLDQLGVSLRIALRHAAIHNRDIDVATYVATLRHLPVPDPGAVESAVLEVVLAEPGIADDALCSSVLKRLGRDPDDELTRDVLDLIMEELLDEGPLTGLADNRTVHSCLAVGSVLTHRLSPDERKRGVIAASDLTPLNLLAPLRLHDGEEIEVFEPDPDGPGELAWQGPDGWLDAFDNGHLLAVSVTDDGRVTIRAVDEPVPDEDLIQRVRRAYEIEVGLDGLPVPLHRIVYHMLLEDPATFTETRLPLGELCEAAGLQCRAGVVADQPEVWERQAETDLIERAMRQFEEEEHQSSALGAVERLIDTGSSPAQLRQALRLMREREVFAFAADELVYRNETDPEALASADDISGRLLVSAHRKSEVAVANLFASLVAERQGKPLAARDFVTRALEADPSWAPALDRAAWYAFERGDAAEAVRLWTLLEEPPLGDLAVARQFADAPQRKVGRNQLCWCGSGRKFKACHFGHPDLPRLPDRFEWLQRKATAYIMRRGIKAREHIVRHAMARVLNRENPDEDPAEILADPIVVDTVLTEGGWFERFVAERGPLLPDDEALLAAAWVLVPRSVYEVLEVRPGSGMTLRDLGTASIVEVREEALSHKIPAGEHICARAVPDGESHQLAGAVFPVMNGTEADLLKMCDNGLGEALCGYVAELHRPPVLRTREDEPLVMCTALVRVPDPKALRRFLFERYIPDRGGWVEVYSMGPGDNIIRAQLGLHGNHLTIQTHSEPRMERVLGVLRSAFSGLRVLRDERRAPEPDELSELPGLPGIQPDELPTTARLDLIAANIQTSLEHRWVDHPNSILGGLTPRQAATDPTRLDQLERLISTFPSETERRPDGPIFARPERLRELLGLPAPVDAG